MRIAFIGNIYSQCGIATYNERLLNSLKNYEKVHFFAEKNGREDTVDITYCWDRNEFPKISLVDKVDEFKPDVVLFSHEYGIFPKAYYYSSLVSYFKLRSYKVATIFHSVYEHHKDKLTSESICKNVIVHTHEAREALIRKGLNPENVSVVPHGCSFDGEILPKLWNHLGNVHVILQAGFLFEYKNHSEMLDIVHELKEKYKDVLYIIVASENPKCQAEHDSVYQKLVKKIEDLGLQHNVVIDKGFVSDSVLMSYIRTSSVFVLPYRPSKDFDVYAASGMARVVLQTSTPLLVSRANLFNGMEEIVPRLESKNEWVDNISQIFDKKFDSKSLVENRKQYLSDNSWNNVSQKLVNIFTSAK